MTGLFDALLDDAAVFPPGSMPLAQAVRGHLAHRAHRASEQGFAGLVAPLVGPLVLPAAVLDPLVGLTSSLPEDSFELALTVTLPELEEAIRAGRRVRAARLVAVEVVLPDDFPLDRPLADTAGIRMAAGLRVFVELPRDARRPAVLDAVADAGLAAKLRTGGMRAELHPDEAELAAGVRALVAAGVPFKATAGLHRAVRNTDHGSGFEQHGFLNVLLAVDAARRGADLDSLVALLADRDRERVAALAGRLPLEVRESFRSFGTCSISEPVEDLLDLGLLPAPAGSPA